MRLAFFLLLLANLAFLAWARWIDTPRAAPANEAVARLPRLQLVNEPSQAPSTTTTSGGTRKMAVRTPVEAARVSAETARCVSVGPFNDLADSTRAAAQLRDRGFAPQQRTADGETSQGFWVFIDGVSSDADAARMLGELQRGGVQDATEVPDSEVGRRISVGLFTKRENAEHQAEVVRNIGLAPEITERKQAATVYWLDVSLGAGAGNLATGGLAPDGAGGSRIGVQPCPGGAGVQPAPPVGRPQAGRASVAPMG